MKKLLLFLLMLTNALVTFAQADSGKKALVVRYDGQDVFSFFLNHEPKLTIENGWGIIEADGTYYDEFDQADYQLYWSFLLSEDSGVSLTFETVDWEGYNDIKDMKEENVVPQFSLKDGKVTVSCQTTGETLSVYSLDGKMVGNAKAGADGKASVQLPASKTVYIVKSGKANFKILSK